MSINQARIQSVKFELKQYDFGRSILTWNQMLIQAAILLDRHPAAHRLFDTAIRLRLPYSPVINMTLKNLYCLKGLNILRLKITGNRSR
jgi:hypothetical protein